MRISRRLPSWQKLAQVYAIAVLLIYSWTILWFFWKLPTWRIILTTGEILGALAYLLATNLAESLTVLVPAIVLALVLPKKWFDDVFVARGTALVIAGLGYLMFLGDQLKYQGAYPSLSLAPWLLSLPLVLVAAIVYLAGRVDRIRKIAESIADRAVIFLYVMIPLSLVSLFVILIGLTP